MLRTIINEKCSCAESRLQTETRNERVSFDLSVLQGRFPSQRILETYRREPNTQVPSLRLHAAISPVELWLMLDQVSECSTSHHGKSKYHYCGQSSMAKGQSLRWGDRSMDPWINIVIALRVLRPDPATDVCRRGTTPAFGRRVQVCFCWSSSSPLEVALAMQCAAGSCYDDGSVPVSAGTMYVHTYRHARSLDLFLEGA